MLAFPTMRAFGGSVVSAAPRAGPVITSGSFSLRRAPARTSSSAAPQRTKSSAWSSAASDLAQRSLFVNVRPPPATLSERRSVLGVLERYGKAEMFKKLADNGSFVCIASTTTMAAALVQRSPLQYELLAETLEAAQPWGAPRVAPAVQSILQPASGAAPSPSRPPSPANASLAQRSFVISVFPSENYHHRTAVRSSPLHGPWPRDDEATSRAAAVASNADGYRDTFVYNALKQVVPESASSEALCDWRPRTEAAGRGLSDRAGPAAHVHERRARRAHANKSLLSSLGKAGSDSKDDRSRSGKPDETERPGQ